MSPTAQAASVQVARVVPNVTGLDKQFDYLVPSDLAALVEVGSLVRVPLHGRRVGGWVVAVGPPDPAVPVERLLPIAKWSSVGPGPELVALAEWASVRWACARVRPFLVAADPPTMVARLGVPRRTVVSVTATPAETAAVSGMRWTTPLTDPLPMVAQLVRRGPCLVVHPSPAAARAVAHRLRREGFTVALLPDDWAIAASGVDAVVGGRTAVWGPCPDLRTIVVLDEHDEALQEERAPTWHARDVAIERAARAGASCVLVSPCPTLTAMMWAGDRVVRATAGERVSGWPRLEIVDRSAEEPWRRSLLSSPLIAHLRNARQRVVCVLNSPGRARLLACRSCRQLQRCTNCDAAVAQSDVGLLQCERCSTTRPAVCQSCGSSAMAVVKAGVTRLREELEAAANRPVGLVTGGTDELPATDVYVGTEAVLHRVRSVDVVAFLDIDAELLAPRYRAAEHTMGLIVRAGRLVGPPSGHGRVLVQTFVPDHPILQAVLRAEPSRVIDDERPRRRLLGLPPFRALALIEGAGSAEFAAAVAGDAATSRSATVESAPSGSAMLLRADDWMSLGEAINSAPRTRGGRIRVAVDPPRV